MSSQNPEAAIDAIVGKVYTFRENEYRGTNACLMALARAGIELVDIEKNLFNAGAVGVYVLTLQEDPKAVRRALSLATEDLITAAQNASADWSPEDMGTAAAIVLDIAQRFTTSFTKYANEGGHALKNV